MNNVGWVLNAYLPYLGPGSLLLCEGLSRTFQRPFYNNCAHPERHSSTLTASKVYMQPLFNTTPQQIPYLNKQ